MALKVVQWATGPVGRSALRHLILNPAYELAGLYVHGPEKVGVDAGQLVGLPPTGIRATNDRNLIYGLAADAVVYTPRMHMVLEDMDREVLALLESGKSVVTPSGYWYPPLYGPAYVERIEAACRQGKASLFGSGENPGFFLARMATLAASAQRAVDGLQPTASVSHGREASVGSRSASVSASQPPPLAPGAAPHTPDTSAIAPPESPAPFSFQVLPGSTLEFLGSVS